MRVCVCVYVRVTAVVAVSRLIFVSSANVFFFFISLRGTPRENDLAIPSNVMWNTFSRWREKHSIPLFRQRPQHPRALYYIIIMCIKVCVYTTTSRACRNNMAYHIETFYFFVHAIILLLFVTKQNVKKYFAVSSRIGGSERILFALELEIRFDTHPKK